MIENIIKTMTKTKWNYILSFYFDIAVALGMFVLALFSELSIFTIVPLFILGLFVFTFIEYMIHAWLFHGSIKIFVQGHASHHRNPYGYDALPFFTGGVVTTIIALGLALLIGFDSAMAFGAGGLLGYVSYGLMHHVMHRKDFNFKYYRYMVKLHDSHHQDIKMNHGVTTPIWDIVFGTYRPSH